MYNGILQELQLLIGDLSAMSFHEKISPTGKPFRTWWTRARRSKRIWAISTLPSAFQFEQLHKVQQEQLTATGSNWSNTCTFWVNQSDLLRSSWLKPSSPAPGMFQEFCFKSRSKLPNASGVLLWQQSTKTSSTSIQQNQNVWASKDIFSYSETGGPPLLIIARFQ